MSTRSINRCFLLLLLAAFTFGGCLSSGERENIPEDFSSLSLIFHALRSSESALKTLVIDVTADGMDEVHQQFVLSAEDGSGTCEAALTLPSGPNRLFVVTALENRNDVAYQGSKMVDLLPGPQSFAIDLTGYCRIEGALYQIDYSTEFPHQGDPVTDFEGSGLSGGRYEVTTNADGRFQADLETGYSLDIYAQNETHTSFAEILPEYGGEDFSIQLFFADILREYTLPFLILGAVRSQLDIGEQIEIFGRFDASVENLVLVFSKDINEFYSSPVFSLDDDHISAAVPDNLAESPLPYVVYLAVPGVPDIVQVSNSFQFTKTE